MNKLIGECSDNYHYSIGKKAIDADHLTLSEETETNRKVPKFHVGDSVRVTTYKNNFSKGYTKSWSREIVAIGSLLKTNPSMYRIKDAQGKRICEKELLLSKLQTSSYPEPDSHIDNKVKVALDLSNYTT